MTTDTPTTEPETTETAEQPEVPFWDGCVRSVTVVDSGLSDDPRDPPMSVGQAIELDGVRIPCARFEVRITSGDATRVSVTTHSGLVVKTVTREAGVDEEGEALRELADITVAGQRLCTPEDPLDVLDGDDEGLTTVTFFTNRVTITGALTGAPTPA